MLILSATFKRDIIDAKTHLLIYTYTVMYTIDHLSI